MEVISKLAANKHRSVLVIHSWWGLTQSFREFGNALAESGFTVGLADLFDGKTAELPAQVNRLRRAPRREPMYKNLIRGIEQLQTIAGTKSPVGVVGFSMGGHWAVWLSQQQELAVKSTVLYYSARAGSFESSRSSFLAHFAEHDDFVSANAKRKMEQQLKKAGRSFTSFNYAGTSHWFAESDRSKEFDDKAASSALKRTIDHLDKSL